MENILLILILAAVIFSAVWVLIQAKKRGEHCVGCPYAKQCGKGGRC